MPSQDADTVDQARSPLAGPPQTAPELEIQPAGFLIQLSLDWIIRRASENVGDFLGESHVTLIDEPFGRFVQAQALHDLRNHFSRLSGSTGVARAYRVRLTDDRPRFDVAFQLADGRVLLEAVASPEHGLGQATGAVGGLIEGLTGLKGAALLDSAARRMRALTGCDGCVIVRNDGGTELSATSCRGSFASAAIAELPPILADTSAKPVPIFPRKPGDRSLTQALLKSPSAETLAELRDRGVGSAMNVPLTFEGRPQGEIQVHSLVARKPNLELHSAAELFAQMLALRLEVDRLRD